MVGILKRSINKPEIGAKNPSTLQVIDLLECKVEFLVDLGHLLEIPVCLHNLQYWLVRLGGMDNNEKKDASSLLRHIIIVCNA